MLDEVFQSIWKDLAIPVGGEPNPYRLMQLATVGPQGWPRCRTVVLRDVDRDRNELFFYADERSAKCAQILADSRVSLAALKPGGAIQLRVEGMANLVENLEFRQRHWDTARDTTQALFKHGAVPGEMIQSPSEAYERIQNGFEDFAIVRVRVTALDWLDLSSAIHRRAGFTRQQKQWKSAWLVP